MSKNGGLKISIPVKILQNSEWELIDPILVDKSAFDKSIFFSLAIFFASGDASTLFDEIWSWFSIAGFSFNSSISFNCSGLEISKFSDSSTFFRTHWKSAFSSPIIANKLSTKAVSPSFIPIYKRVPS